ncbi:MAG TPA: hypothetical protein VL973_12385 [Sphingomonas sp.]|nr:hypothetical protein [Sphingomonas sp.]
MILMVAGVLDALGVGPWVRDSAQLYPWINVAHVLGVVTLVGAIAVVDLRFAGLWRALPVAPLASALTPVAIWGFVVMLASGVLLFAADAPTLARSDVFQLKLGLIGLAVVNAAIFRWRSRRAGGGGAQPLLALISLGLWVSIVVAGRMIAYS